MTFESPVLRKAAKGRSCVKCGATENVVGCHYTGVRRLSYGGGYGIKVHDFLLAHLCGNCHREMDLLYRDKEKKWLHSEEFLHYIALTLTRLFEEGIVGVK
jgi:hypothetical protein